MSKRQNGRWSRREFLSTAALAGTGALLGLQSNSFAAEPPPETTKLTLGWGDGICQAPQLVAEALLKSEGFTDVQFLQSGGRSGSSVASGKIQITQQFVGPLIMRIDAGEPVVLLGGGHIGCLELFGTDRVRNVRDLKGKTVVLNVLDGPPHIFLAIVMAHIGLDPRKDIKIITRPAAEAVRLFEEGKVDAFIASPPAAQELRARKVGHIVVDSTTDRPWSQYFCCMVVANRDFVRKHPVATKRAMRALLKSADICALEPERAARTLVDKGFTKRYDYALQTMKELPYGKWRDYDPEDTVRFYSLRLQEVGMIKSSPQKILAEGTDWRFLRELKKELKA
ncbi:MAG TPA: ABC transporter substrate-binding protein [Candidatus Binatia bacterium]|nr:ABC transporter substrate-binding protein [Candidatus Binatia bacterium]